MSGSPFVQEKENEIFYLGSTASLRFDKRLNFSINPRNLSIFYRLLSNRSEALIRRKETCPQHIHIEVGLLFNVETDN